MNRGCGFAFRSTRCTIACQIDAKLREHGVALEWDSSLPTLSFRPQQITARAVICGVEEPCVYGSIGCPILPALVAGEPALSAVEGVGILISHAALIILLFSLMQRVAHSSPPLA